MKASRAAEDRAPYGLMLAPLLDAPFAHGDVMTRDEFIRRWDEYPNLKRAELIGGVVFMPPPLSIEHGSDDTLLVTWSATYAYKTQGCYSANNTTWYMLKDAPQPDSFLAIKKEFGGQSWIEDSYCHGSPELAVEICRTSASYDLHQKLQLYQKGGVREYVALIVNERRVRWMVLRDGRFEDVALPADGIYRSAVFPGLWLNTKAVASEDGAGVLKTLEKGMKSAEHKSFVRELAKRGGKGKRGR